METPGPAQKKPKFGGHWENVPSIMALETVLPKGLIVANFKWYVPNWQGVQVPIDFVPEDPYVPEEKQLKSSTVKVKVSETVKKTYTVLVEGGTEVCINHVKAHKRIISAQS